MLFLVSMMKFVSFPERKDSIFQKASNKNVDIEITSSGSLGLYFDGKCHQTFPNVTISVDEDTDWCSNVAKSNEEKPWISYSLKNKVMKLTGYSVRNGCCHNRCCCYDDETFIDGSVKCCWLYSFSLQGSNDNKTWKIIHKIEEDNEFYYCQFKTYEFQQTESFRYVRFVSDEPYPKCPFCMQINQIELYGETVESFFSEDIEDNDESVSIIGKLNKNIDE